MIKIKKFLTKIWVLPEKPQNPAVSGIQEQTPSSVKEQTAIKTIKALEQKILPEEAPKNKVQILRKKILEDQEPISSIAQSDQQIRLCFLIPSFVKEGKQIWFRTESDYIKGILIVIKNIFEKKFKKLNILSGCTEEKIANWYFDKSIESKEWLPDRKIVLVYKKDGWYIEMIGKEPTWGWDFNPKIINKNADGTHDANHYYKQIEEKDSNDKKIIKKEKILEIKTMNNAGNGTDGVDVFGKRISRYIGYGDGIEVKPDGANKLVYYAGRDGFVDIDTDQFKVPRSIAMNNTIHISKLDMGTLKDLRSLWWDYGRGIVGEVGAELNMNLNVDGNIEDWVYVKTAGDIFCRIIGSVREVISTRWQILISRAIQWAKIRGNVISVKKKHDSTSITGTNTIFVNTLQLSHTTFLGDTTIYLWNGILNKNWVGLFELKRFLLMRIESKESEIKSQEEKIENGYNKIRTDLTALTSEPKKNEEDKERRPWEEDISIEKKEALKTLLSETEPYSPISDLEKIESIFDNFHRNPRNIGLWKEKPQFQDFLAICEKKEALEKTQDENKQRLQEIDNKLRRIVVSLDGEVRKSGKITIFYWVKKRDDGSLKHIPIKKDGPVHMHLKYNLDTDELEEISKEEAQKKIELISHHLPGIRR